MVDLNAAVDAVVTQLRDAGVSAAADIRDLNLPGVYVTPPTLAYRYGRGDTTATWTAYACTMASGRAEALAELSILLDATTQALWLMVTDATPADVDSPEGGPRLPAYRITWTTRLENDHA